MADASSRNPLARISAKDCEDYAFIGRELERLATLPIEAQIANFRGDPWGSLFTLKGANGSEFPLSRAGQERFVQIAKRGLKALGAAAADHRIERVLEKLKDELSTSVLNGFVPTDENSHTIFSIAIEKLKSEYKEVTHYIPCSLVSQRRTENFNIGPVSFQLRERFIKDNGHRIVTLEVESKNAEFAQNLRTRLYSFFGDCQWVASITIPACDEKVSRRRAHSVLQKALDVFKLFVGSARASDVKQAYDLRTPSDYVDLSSSSGTFFFVIGGRSHDAILNDEWYEQVVTQPALPIITRILWNYCARRSDSDELQARFLDGISWHSDAISEQDSGARIVKFWIAIERILGSSREANLCSRAAVLISDNPADFRKRAQDLSTAYQRRSAVVHGSANRANESWYETAMRISEEASSVVLFQYLFSIDGIDKHPASTARKKLSAWLKHLDQIASAYRNQSPDSRNIE
jgi:hypothetical protein